MNDKQQVEIDFWKNVFNSQGQNYLAYRAEDAYKILSPFGLKIDGFLSGNTLEVGCGLISMLEYYQGVNVWSIDPLVYKYNEIIESSYLKDRHPITDVKYFTVEDEQIPFGYDNFNQIFCVNVLDHTSDPVLMLKEMKRTLRDNGRLYLQVNFDNNLSPAHYSLFNQMKLDTMTEEVGLRKIFEKSVDGENQIKYYAIYAK